MDLCFPQGSPEQNTTRLQPNKYVIRAVKTQRSSDKLSPNLPNNEAQEEALSPRVWDTIPPGSSGKKIGIFFWLSPNGRQRGFWGRWVAHPQRTSKTFVQSQGGLTNCKRKTFWICLAIPSPKELLSATWSIWQSPGGCDGQSTRSWRTTNAR